MPFPQKGSIRFYDEISLVRLGWYLSPPGIFLAWLGGCITLNRLLKRGQLVLLPFVLTLSFFALFYLYKSRAFPENYWVVRRYVEIVIPGFLLLASLSLVSLTEYLQRVFSTAKGRLRLVRVPILIAGGAVVLLAGLEIGNSYPLLQQAEWVNTFRQLENLTGAIHNADVVLMEGGQFQDFFSSPLKFIFRKTVYAFANDKPDLQAFDTIMDEWTGQGKRVFLLASEEQTDLRSTKYLFVPGERFLFRTQVVERVYEHIPEAMENLQFTVQIYQVVKRLQPEDPNSVTANIGYNFGTRTEGFYTTELSSEYEPFRWSNARSSIELPSLPASHDGLLLLRWRQVLPDGVPSMPVRVSLNGDPIGEAQPHLIFEVSQWRIPRPLLNREGKNVIQFSSNAYSPARQGGEDIRELAFMLNYVKLQILAPITVSRPYAVDFGAGSDVLDAGLSGFYGRERNSYRWAGPTSQVTLPLPLAPDPAMEVSLGAMKASPDPNLKQFLALSLNGIQIGKQELVGGWGEFRTYHFAIPSGVPPSRNTVIKIAVTPHWTPGSTDYYTDDWRILGCAIDWLKIGGRAQ